MLTNREVYLLRYALIFLQTKLEKNPFHPERNLTPAEHIQIEQEIEQLLQKVK